MKNLLLASAVSLIASIGTASAQGPQGVYICNGADPITQKLYCGGAEVDAAIARREAEKWWDEFLANAKKVPVTSYIGKGKPGGLLRQPEVSAFSQEEWNASLGR
jgi:hypothetical protein